MSHCDANTDWEMKSILDQCLCCIQDVTKKKLIELILFMLSAYNGNNIESMCAIRHRRSDRHIGIVQEQPTITKNLEKNVLGNKSIHRQLLGPNF